MNWKRATSSQTRVPGPHWRFSARVGGVPVRWPRAVSRESRKSHWWSHTHSGSEDAVAAFPAPLVTVGRWIRAQWHSHAVASMNWAILAPHYNNLDLYWEEHREQNRVKPVTSVSPYLSVCWVGPTIGTTRWRTRLFWRHLSRTPHTAPV